MSDNVDDAGHQAEQDPWLPDLVPVGGESVHGSAGDRRCLGHVNCWSTTATMPDVMAALTVRFGPHVSTSDDRTTWRRQTTTADSEPSEWAEAWVAGGVEGVPGFEPAKVPAAAQCVVAIGSMQCADPSVPATDPGRQFRRRFRRPGP